MFVRRNTQRGVKNMHAIWGSSQQFNGLHDRYNGARAANVQFDTLTRIALRSGYALVTRPVSLCAHDEVSGDSASINSASVSPKRVAMSRALNPC